MPQIFDNAIDLGARLGARRSSLAGVDRRCSDDFLGNRFGLLLQLIDHRIDVAARLTQPFVEPLVEAFLEHLFPLGERLLALRELRVGLVEGAPLALELDAIALERTRLGIEARQVRLQPLLIVAEISARRGDRPVAGMPRRCAISIARLRPGAP